MKKRIIAILLSLSVFCYSFNIGNRRASAAPAAAVTCIAAVAMLAWELLDVMNGGYDNTIKGLGEALVNIPRGMQLVFYGDDIINPATGEVIYHEDGLLHSLGYNVAEWCQDLFDKGEIEIVDDRIKLSYQQYLQLCKELISVAPQPGVDFESNQPAFFLDLEGMPYQFPIGALPTYSSFFHEHPGESYALCYYNDEQIVFSDYYILSYRTEALDQYNRYNYNYSFESLTQQFYVNHIGGVSSSYFPDRPNSVNPFENPDFNFTFEGLSSSSISYLVTTPYSKDYNTSNCFVFTNGALTYTPISDVDVTGCQLGLVTTSHDYAGFLQSLTGYAAVEGTPIDDLSGVLPSNSSLSFPVNPDLSRPLDDQIIVVDVPGVSDLPLSDYQAKLKTDIEVPSIIVTKFPFCIPFDFMRFLGLLCSDPVAPVFRIPISTNPGNLQQWQGNQTVGEYLTPSEPMFEIDEEIVIDLSVIPLVQPICYTCFIIGFIIMLLHITPKMIQH